METIVGANGAGIWRGYAGARTQYTSTDKGVGDIDGRGDMSYMAAREKTDTKKAQEIKGWNGRGPMRYPWKLMIGAALIYYFFIKK